MRIWTCKTSFGKVWESLEKFGKPWNPLGNLGNQTFPKFAPHSRTCLELFFCMRKNDESVDHCEGGWGRLRGFSWTLVVGPSCQDLVVGSRRGHSLALMLDSCGLVCKRMSLLMVGLVGRALTVGFGEAPRCYCDVWCASEPARHEHDTDTTRYGHDMDTTRTRCGHDTDTKRARRHELTQSIPRRARDQYMIRSSNFFGPNMQMKC